LQKNINSINYNIIQPLYNFIKISNLKYSEINVKYVSLYNKINYANELSKINNIQITFDNSFRIPLLVQGTNEYIVKLNTSILIINILDFNQYYKSNIKLNSTTILNDINNLLFNYMTQLKIIKDNLYAQLTKYNNLYNIANRENINFAWVEYLGHQIINRIEVEIGGKIIDFTDAVRMNINYQLTSKIMHEITYNKLLGNVKELTTYNIDSKPSYTLLIPINFWFSKYSGLALPLIHLRYHEVRINVELNDLIN
jgi:hypothetical protein